MTAKSFGFGVVLAVVLALAPSRASAAWWNWGWFDRGERAHEGDHGRHDEGRHHEGRHDEGRHGPSAVPEFDPAAVGIVTAVIAGGTLVVARRRKR